LCPKALKSNAYHFYRRGEPNTEPEKVLIDAWFAKDFNYEPSKLIIEQNLEMPYYNSMLTIK
jgi:hypothetical protein